MDPRWVWDSLHVCAGTVIHHTLLETWGTTSEYVHSCAACQRENVYHGGVTYHKAQNIDLSEDVQSNKRDYKYNNV